MLRGVHRQHICSCFLSIETATFISVTIFHPLASDALCLYDAMIFVSQCRHEIRMSRSPPAPMQIVTTEAESARSSSEVSSRTLNLRDYYFNNLTQAFVFHRFRLPVSVEQGSHSEFMSDLKARDSKARNRQHSEGSNMFEVPILCIYSNLRCLNEFHLELTDWV
jgi:hypothetical protein